MDLRTDFDRGVKKVVQAISNVVGSQEAFVNREDIRFDPMVDRTLADLEEGTLEVQASALDKVRGLEDETARTQLADKLWRRINQRPGPPLKRADSSAESDVASWLLSALVIADVKGKYRGVVTEVVLGESTLSERGRLMVLAEAHRVGNTYWQKLAQQAFEQVPNSAIAVLARVLLFPEGAREIITGLLGSADPERRRWALWVLRVTPMPEVVNYIGDILDDPLSTKVIYDALYALGQPGMAEAVAGSSHPALAAHRLVLEVLSFYGAAHGLARRVFVDLLAALEAKEVDVLLTQPPDDQQAAQAARDLSLLLARIRQSRATENRPPYLPGYATDSLIGVRALDADRLGIGKDVVVLTSVMLAKDVTPPLAIGLFGDWGTGKSFFMQAMQEQTALITEVSVGDTDSPFCSDVVTIRFNAWHYADANLMASLVSHIWTELAEHVSPTVRPVEVEARLETERTSRIAEAATAENALAETDRQIADRERELESLAREREQREVRLRDLNADDLSSLLEPKEKEKVQDVLEEVGVPAVVSSSTDLTRAAADVNVMWRRGVGLVQALWAPGNRLTTLGLVLFVLVAGPLIALVVDLLEASGVVTAVAAISAEVVALIGTTVAAIRQAVAWFRPRLETIEAAKQKVDAKLAEKRAEPTTREVALQQEIEALHQEREQATVRLTEAKADAVRLAVEIQDSRERRSLAYFVGERLQSGDYERHLGLTATIRRDFEALIDRLANVPPEQEEGPRPVDRIVLYIDDLDRCTEMDVVKVLQAVHLLLAYPLFVVVVGVDPRWLMHSLRKGHLAFEDDKGANAWTTTPQNYLEKIFQIPFALRRMNGAGYGDLVAGLLDPAAEVERESVDVVTSGREEPGAPESTGEVMASEAHAVTTSGEEEPAPIDADDTEVGNRSTTTVSPPAPIFVVDREALVIRSWEAGYARGLHALIRTPRAVKRFANIYRLLKAPVKDLEGFEGSAKELGEFQVPMLLLAVSVGASEVAKALLPALSESARANSSAYHALMEIDVGGLDLSSTTPEAVGRIVRDMKDLMAENSFPTSSELLRKWIRRVARYSFDLGKATGLDVE